ncbi:MAG TPA: histone deacetylase [Longimicrobiales bacterium]|nr:histone deacetylase [Longimicrobiales bacterium]
MSDAGTTRRAGPEPLSAALVMHPDCARHDTGWGHPEHQGRLPAVVQALYRNTPALLDHLLQHEARPVSEQQLQRVHSAPHIELVRSAAADAARTGAPVNFEPDTVVSAASWDAAVAAAGCAVDAVGLVLTDRARTAFAVCRPPGHHATQDRAMGFCLFNNIAVAARAAQAEHGIERVLIIDWDVHHGNGTQDIFYDDGRVYYASLHLGHHYPGTGAAEERGVGGGRGTTLNVPLEAGTTADVYLRLFEDTLARACEESRPELVLVSAGYDCLLGDPLGGLRLEPEHIHRMTRLVVERAQETAAGRVVAALEGGYVPQRVGAGVVATLRALAGIAY